ncbi:MULTISPECIES: hypothetical protein [unclassified Streptomyces]|uniref:hypothetical protein n=1 Tax=unclassified Streptomyces TaxID=2593676 RepID=UPI0036B1DE01
MSPAKGPLKGRAARLGRLMPSGPSSAARTPFVLLVVVLLGGGLISLLLLNSALNQGSFKLRELKDRTTELTDEEQALQRDVDAHAAPDALERAARRLGMVPGGSPAFLGPDGKVLGVPSAAPSPEPSPTPVPDPPTEPPPAPPATAGAAQAPPATDQLQQQSALDPAVTGTDPAPTDQLQQQSALDPAVAGTDPARTGAASGADPARAGAAGIATAPPTTLPTTSGR